ncbi:MAG: hypothetical protein JNM09_18855 [Blastocatellia bacterium]|nr:hypothetical protein [Blastocatellia bacterium]
MKFRCFTLVLFLFAGLTAQAQNEAVLQQAFEGKTVTVKIDMPGTHQGVDLYPNRDRMMDFDAYSRRIKQFGAALRNGDSVLVTKVRVKEKNIEFQLGGGGYGTAGDDTDTSVKFTSAPKSRREKALEEDLKNTTDSRERKQIQDDLNYERRQREREDSRNRAQAEEAAEAKKDRIERRRLEGGSRFNIWFEPRIPAAGVTPNQLMELLAEYLDFGTRRDAQSRRPDVNAPISDDAILRLRKGMTQIDVMALFGSPRRKSEKGDGDTKIMVLMYQIGERDIQIEMMSDVVIRYVISSR